MMLFSKSKEINFPISIRCWQLIKYVGDRTGFLVEILQLIYVFAGFWESRQVAYPSLLFIVLWYILKKVMRE
jgi:hypothetical protein